MPEEESADQQQSDEGATEIPPPPDPPEIELQEATAGREPPERGIFKTGIKPD